MWSRSISAARNSGPVTVTVAAAFFGLAAGPAPAAGRDADTVRYPYVAALSRMSGGERVYFCAGALVAPRWILTAAHCFHDRRGRRIDDGDLWAEVGGALLAEVPEAAQVRFDLIVVHPDYDPASQASDLALVRLDQEAGPLIATPAGDARTEGEPAAALGFGSFYEGLLAGRALSRTGAPTAQISDRLRQAELPLVDPAGCAAGLGIGGEATGADRLCTGGEAPDACLGDSGGPLVAGRSEGADRLVGIVSFGSGCAAQSPLVVYTRVSAYAPWIERVIAVR